MEALIWFVLLCVIMGAIAMFFITFLGVAIRAIPGLIGLALLGLVVVLIGGGVGHFLPSNTADFGTSAQSPGSQGPSIEASANRRTIEREQEVTSLPIFLELKEDEVAQLVLPQGELAKFKVRAADHKDGEYVIPFSPVTGEFKSSLGNENCNTTKGIVTSSTCWGMPLFQGLPINQVEGPLTGELTLNISASMRNVTLPEGTKILILVSSE